MENNKERSGAQLLKALEQWLSKGVPWLKSVPTGSNKCAEKFSKTYKLLKAQI